MTSSSVMRAAFLVLAMIAAVGYGQQPGTATVEAHPALPIQTCTAQGACTTAATTITLDSNWRWTHDVGGYANCYTGNTWSTTYCPTPTACASNCALEGLALTDYASTYGITTAGTELTVGFVTKSANTNVGSRVYLMQDESTYMIFKLKNQEFAFDVDASNLPCGLNGAIYFSEMAADGGLSAYPGNTAGAKFGTGYCDSQCPHDIKFINGEANILGWTPASNDPNSGTGQYGTCCNELDIWEANSISTAFTPHPCSVTGQTRCLGTDCGDGTQRYDGVCDKDGCDFNSYRMGNQSFYGPDMIINSAIPVTVVTQFLTSDGTANGDLVEIKRFYKQNGVVVPNSASTFSSLNKANSLTDSGCIAQKTLFGDTNKFSSLGGLKAMGDSMARGMVLVMSLWDDHVADCLWLDSTYPTTASASTPGAARGSCPTTSGVPATVEANSPGATVKYSNIKVGAIGSTTAGVPASTSSAVNQASTATGSTTPTTPPGGGAGAGTGGSNTPTNAPGASGTPTNAPGAGGDSLISAAGLVQVSAVVALVAVVMMM